MFEKIKNILKRLFKKQKLLEENVLKTNSFKQELTENTAIYNTQKMYDEGKITEDEMKISDIRKLINLYKEQINMLDREITTKKAKIQVDN